MNRLSLELKTENVTKEGTFEGYASIFGNVDLGGDIVEKGAFKASLAEHQANGTTVKMFWNHNHSEPIGIWEDLEEDEKGLRGKGRFVLTVQRARETYDLMKAGAISGLSIGYETVKKRMEDDIRILQEVKLWEASPVSIAMNQLATATSVKSGLQSIAEKITSGQVPEIKEFEKGLREAGFSKGMARDIASVGYAKAVRSESEGDQAKQALEFLQALRSDQI